MEDVAKTASGDGIEKVRKFNLERFLRGGITGPQMPASSDCSAFHHKIMNSFSGDHNCGGRDPGKCVVIVLFYSYDIWR